VQASIRREPGAANGSDYVQVLPPTGPVAKHVHEGCPAEELAPVLSVTPEG